MAAMSEYFRVVCVDYDGTIALGPRPTDAVLAAIARVRAGGRQVVLVSGRIIEELLSDFADAAQHFDAIVGENGAVVWRNGRTRAVAPRVSDELEFQLVKRGVRSRRGIVILAMDAVHDQAVLRACVELGLDAQLVRNREALMVLPAGVSKGSGLQEALAELGLSYHNAIGVGDAENDLALLESCEVGVAVGNAVRSLKDHADIVLEDSGPPAIVQFLEVDVPRGLPGVEPRRRRIVLGRTDDGSIVSVPGSRVQVFIDGPTGAGKSHLAGLFLERLHDAGYTACVIDMEGDHALLGQLRGVLTLGGREPLPPPEEVGRIVRHRFSSIVLDLSLREPEIKHAYARELLEQLTSVRQQCGLPHWIVVEEAHALPSESLDRARAEGSLCLVTYQPDWLPGATRQAADIVLTVEAPEQVRMRTTRDPDASVCFRPDIRQTPHVRHRRKYAEGRVPYERGFTFRDGHGAVGAHVSSLAELRSELSRAPANMLAHHAAQRDFSRWIRDVFQDELLAASVRRAEASFRMDRVELFRSAFREFIGLRYELGS